MLSIVSHGYLDDNDPVSVCLDFSAAWKDLLLKNMEGRMKDITDSGVIECMVYDGAKWRSRTRKANPR